MNTLLNNLYDQSIISDFRDKGSIAWVLYKGRPFIVISPYGLLRKRRKLNKGSFLRKLPISLWERGLR